MRAEIIGREQIRRIAQETQIQERYARQKFLGSVAMVCEVFAQEGREVTAESVAAYLAPMDARATVAATAAALAEIAAITEGNILAADGLMG